jgi:hypothetical protein
MSYSSGGLIFVSLVDRKNHARIFMRAVKLTICLFLFFTLLSGSQCSKDTSRYEEVRFDFLIPISVAPLKDTIRVGEELTITTQFSDSVYDIKSGKRYYMPDFNWKPLLYIKKLVAPDKTISSQPTAGSQFEYSSVIGGFVTQSNSAAGMKYVYENKQYKLVAKVKPNEPGVFYIVFTNDFSPGQVRLPQSFAPNTTPGVNRVPVIGFMRNYVNNGQTNYHILRQHCYVEIPGLDSISIWDYKNGGYTFVVK